MTQKRPVRRPSTPRTWRTAGGDLLTEADVEALATEAEAGYDLSNARRERVGRPSLGRGNGISPKISFRASAQIYSRLHARAVKEGRPISALARDAIERYISRDPE